MSVPLCNSSRLSSPPPGPPNRTISSSPDGLLTLDEILGSRPKLEATSKAPISTSPSKLALNPGQINQKVTTISSSPPVQPVGVDADASIIEVGSKVSNPREAEAPRKPRTKESETESKVSNGDSRAKAPRKPQAHKALTSKPRPAESSDNSVPAKPKRKTPVQRKKAGTVSVYFNDNKKSSAGEAKPAARRAEETARSSMPNDSASVRSRSPERPKRTKKLLRAPDPKIGLLNSIENNPPTTIPAAEVQDPTKKQTPGKSATSKVPAICSVVDTVKAPRRKVSTLTDLAVAQYDNQNVIDLTFMAGYQDPGLVQSEPTNQNQSKKQRRKKKQKPQDPEMVLLSPGTAMKQADGQCFVFGTSSQLVREDSPTVSRDFQLTIDQSNTMAEEEPTGWFDDEVEIQPSRRPKLWNAACRDDDGSTIDLRDSNTSSGLHEDTVMSNDDSGYIHSVPEVALPKSSPEKPLVKVQEDSEYPDIGIILKSPTNSHPPTSTLARPTPAEEPSIALLTSLSSPPQLPIRDSPTRKPLFTSPNIETIVESLESAQATLEVPQLDLMSDAQLSRRIAEFGFKNIRKRADMISLLENCYRSKYKISASSNAVPISITSKSSFSTSSFSTASSTSFLFARSYEESSVPEPTDKYRSWRSNVESVRSITPPTSAQPPLPDSPSLPSKIKRGRGRPRKSPAISSDLEAINKINKSPPKKSREPSSSRAIAIEIPDSDSSEASSPINLDHESLDGSTMSDNDQLETSFDHDVSPDDPPLTVSPVVEEQAMFESISTAVQTAPRTTDISNPSWYDRILLYDPIPYEDLTVWLNSGQLKRVGYDDEVAAGHVKKWCESRSICCVKRETLNGKKRKRL